MQRLGLKVLFVTGYAQNAVIGNGNFDTGMEVVTKPIGVNVVATKVRALSGR